MLRRVARRTLGKAKEAKAAARSAPQTTASVVPSASLEAHSLAPVYLTLSPSLENKKKLSNLPQAPLVALDPTVFNHPIRRDILYLCVNHYRDGLRQGSANTKNRSEVRGSGRKLRPQKGSGKARLGDMSSPMLRGGATAFGPKPRDFSTKLNRKIVQMGMRVALSSRYSDSRLGIMEKLSLPSGKTNHLANKLDEYGMRKALLVTGMANPCSGLDRASRVLMKKSFCGLMNVQDVTVYHLLKWPRVILDLEAVKYFEKTLTKATVLPIAYPESTTTSEIPAASSS